MAGHSKWANIKHRKAAQDAKRGKAFTRLIRELVVASRQGGPSLEDNSRLRTAVDKALGANMTRDTIDRAISRGSGDSDSDNLDEMTYEGYASSGIAVLIEAMTDNRNRTVAEVRHAFSKHGGNLGTDGSVAYLFERKGFLLFSNGIEEDAIVDVALDSGAEDVISHSHGLTEVTVAWEAFSEVRQAFEQAGIAFIQADISMLPTTCVPLDPSGVKQVSQLIEALEDLDDVQNVYTNAEWPE
ncbi:MAG: YebC/PmpR family DNA-binding transcriptional regulator [Halieaceae bacterium]|nr:YebC/PmpR family DNA-binding transcriptional regulator [Halieaceae bacterium]